VGGWRIIKTMGKKMTKLHEPIDGCAAETAAGTVILAASLGARPFRQLRLPQAQYRYGDSSPNP
jgi:hypothetical protein